MISKKAKPISFEGTLLDQTAKQYAKENAFSVLIDPKKAISEEAYFGVDNPLHVRLVSHLTLMREQWKREKEANPNIRNIELIKNNEASVKELEKIIVEEFNIEGCNVGFMNEVNAACFSQIWNKAVVGKSDEAKKLRVTLDDIVENKNGFKYKDSTGIWYCFVLGLGLIIDDSFTIPEVASIMVHELGHGMQHVVTSINTVAMIEFWKLILEYGSISEVSHIGPSKALKMLKLCRLASKDPEKAKELGEQFLNEMRDSETTDFKTFKSSDITAMVNQTGSPLEGDIETLPPEKKRNVIVRSIVGFFGAIFSVLLGIFILPIMISIQYTIKNNTDYKRFKVFEETADAFCTFYGFGTEQASALAKLNRYIQNTGIGDHGIFTYIPVLDLMASYESFMLEETQLMSGYPSMKQRIVNQYIAMQYELDNNKTLSKGARAELQSQINDIKKIYDTFVAKEAPKGFFYKLISKASRDSLEQAAAKDKNIEENVLKPLKEKADKGFLA